MRKKILLSLSAIIIIAITIIFTNYLKIKLPEVDTGFLAGLAALLSLGCFMLIAAIATIFYSIGNLLIYLIKTICNKQNK